MKIFFKGIAIGMLNHSPSCLFLVTSQLGFSPLSSPTTVQRGIGKLKYNASRLSR